MAEKYLGSSGCSKKILQKLVLHYPIGLSPFSTSSLSFQPTNYHRPKIAKDDSSITLDSPAGLGAQAGVRLG